MRRAITVNNNRFIVHTGDNLPILKTLPDNSVDAIVTDPPAGIGFMQRDWDSDKGGRNKWIEWMAEVAAECLRVIKPGGHALVWALPRTSHWTATAWENAGWEPRDRICHIFGSGFPKSANISKMIDKAAGAEREVVSANPNLNGRTRSIKGGNFGNAQVVNSVEHDITAPATDAAKQWDGWGTALKPAVEDYWLFRKPLAKRTVAANVLEWGTGGVNIDGCRVGTDTIAQHRTPQKTWREREGRSDIPASADYSVTTTSGRFPANLIHDGSDEVVRLFPAAGGGYGKRGGKRRLNYSFGGTMETVGYGDTGSAARFFYAAKASRSEREAGCEGLEMKYNVGTMSGDADGSLLTGSGNPRDTSARNHHPTVKPIALMRYLCRLVTPPGGIVLDPFTGSGTTGCAAMLEGFRFIGLEREEQYVEIAQKRIEYWRQVGEYTPPSAEQAQMTLLDMQDE